MADGNLPRWVRLHETFWLDDKLRKCPVASRYLFIELFAHATMLGLQGHVPTDQLDLLTLGWEQPTADVVEPLSDVKLVVPKPSSLFLPRWSKWQNTAEQQEATTAKRTSEAQRSAQNRAKKKADDAELRALRARLTEIEDAG